MVTITNRYEHLPCTRHEAKCLSYSTLMLPSGSDSDGISALQLKIVGLQEFI